MAKSLLFIDIGKSCLNRDFFTPHISFKAIRKNLIIAKISESTILDNYILNI